MDVRELFRLLAGDAVGESALAVLTNESAAAAVKLMESTEIRLVCLARGRSADAENTMVRGLPDGPPMSCEK
jgi:hypothetical protein